MRFSPRSETGRCAWLESADAFIIDIDGTLIRGPGAMAGAAALLDRLADRFVLVSNNSSDTAAGLAAKLRHYRLTVHPDRLVLAGETAIRRIARHRPGARVMLLASADLHSLARELGIETTGDDPEIVLLGRDEAFSYDKLRAAANALRGGARFVVANPDGFHPDEGHKVVPETGALMQAIIHASGVWPQEIIGKPEPILFEQALAKLQSRPTRTTMIGDNPLTDAAGAVAAGMAYLIIGKAPGAVAATPGDLLTFLGEASVHLPACIPGPLIDNSHRSLKKERDEPCLDPILNRQP